MIGLFIWLAVMCLFLAGAGAALVVAAKARRAFIDTFVHDEAVGCEGAGFGSVRLESRGALPRASLTCFVPAGKTMFWRVHIAAPAFARKTTLKLTSEGVTGFVREHVLGVHDVRIGDDVVDKALNIRGSEPAVVRALFASPEVRANAVAFFGEHRGCSLSVDEGGAVLELQRPREVTASSARAAFVRACEFVALLDGAARDVPALMPPSAADVVDLGASSSSSSGAPVAVPVEMERHR